MKTLSRARLLRVASLGRGDGYCFTCGRPFFWDHLNAAAAAAHYEGANHIHHEIRKLHEFEIIGPAPGAEKARESLECEGLRLVKYGTRAGDRQKGESMVLQAEHDRAMAELFGLKVPPRELPVLKKVVRPATRSSIYPPVGS